MKYTTEVQIYDPGTFQLKWAVKEPSKVEIIDGILFVISKDKKAAFETNLPFIVVQKGE